MTANEALDSYLKSLTSAQRFQISREICASCYIRRHIMYNWRHGLSKIPLLARDKINEIVGRNIFTNVDN